MTHHPRSAHPSTRDVAHVPRTQGRPRPGILQDRLQISHATLLDEAGVSARKIADQLGHSQVSLTQDFYMGRKIASEDAARVLEIIGRPDVAAQIVSEDRGCGE